MDQVLEIYDTHMTSAVEQVVGKAGVVSFFIGKNTITNLKSDVIRETLAELPNHTKEIEAFMDESFDISETLRVRLAGLQPATFEGMLHPVFQQDEWMLLLLGGVLGVVVGSLQAFALGS